MREILTDPDDRLRTMCAPVEKVDGQVLKLIEELRQVLKKASTDKARGMGLAAPQLGELVQVAVIDTPAISFPIINPTIVRYGKEKEMLEGCYSLPGRLFVVMRPVLVKIKTLGEDGEERTIKQHGTIAQAIMHELHHLRGILIEDIKIREVVLK